MARSYALERTVASVASTAIVGTGLAPAAITAAFEPGSITPLMLIFGNAARIAGNASAVAVLHAITTCLASCGVKYAMICCTNRVTVEAVFDPYGSRAVSPK